MRLPTFFKKPVFFSTQEQEAIIHAIQNAEKRTSGEIRIFVESRCKYVQPLDRAAEIFYSAKMNLTAERNGVLVYLALKDHQLAIFADEAIHSKTGKDFWKKEVQTMLSQFDKKNYASGIVTVINEIGEALYQHFPYSGDTDKNELPDDIIFGKL